MSKVELKYIFSLSKEERRYAKKNSGSFDFEMCTTEIEKFLLRLKEINQIS